MLLEILVHAKSKAVIIRDLQGLKKMDSLSAYLAILEEVNRPLSIIEGLKFAKQAFFLGDSNNYSMPSQYDMPGMVEYLRFGRHTGTRQNSFATLLGTFMERTRQHARL